MNPLVQILPHMIGYSQEHHGPQLQGLFQELVRSLLLCTRFQMALAPFQHPLLQLEHHCLKPMSMIQGGNLFHSEGTIPSMRLVIQYNSDSLPQVGPILLIHLMLKQFVQTQALDYELTSAQTVLQIGVSTVRMQVHLDSKTGSLQDNSAKQ